VALTILVMVLKRGVLYSFPVYVWSIIEFSALSVFERIVIGEGTMPSLMLIQIALHLLHKVVRLAVLLSKKSPSFY